MHLARTRAEALPGRDSETYVAAHTRRLEALRRAGIVERLEDGVWRIPGDLPAQGQAHDRRRLGGAIVAIRSYLPLERQVRALGPTWLDRELLREAPDMAVRGFGANVRAALSERSAFLAEQRLAERRGPRLVLARDLLTTLRNRELVSEGERITRETGLAHRRLRDGQRVSGTYRRSVQLISGRFAMLEDGQGVSLVPWRPMLERRLEQPMSAFVQDERVTWELVRTRGPVALTLDTMVCDCRRCCYGRG
jgi:hypothetical protein